MLGRHGTWIMRARRCIIDLGHGLLGGLGMTVEWLGDSDGNRSSVAYFGSREAAEIALASLVNCKNCTNCERCTNCTGCWECAGLFGVSDVAEL